MSQSRVITAQFTKRPRLSFPPCVSASNDEDLPIWLTGEWARKYEIQSASDVLGTWTPLVTVTNQLGRIQFLVPGAANGLQRFYRAIGEP